MGRTSTKGTVSYKHVTVISAKDNTVTFVPSAKDGKPNYNLRNAWVIGKLCKWNRDAENFTAHVENMAEIEKILGMTSAEVKKYREGVKAETQAPVTVVTTAPKVASDASLEKRVAELETEVAELKATLKMLIKLGK